VALPELHVAAFSGGKDSTAMVIAMLENGYRVDRMLITPTGDELPEMEAHWNAIQERVDIPLERPKGPTLSEAMVANDAVPNFRMRFCTRLVKIQPIIAWVTRRLAEYDVTMYVGLRADEEERTGIISEKIRTRFPLRELDMDVSDVWRFLKEREIEIPRRSDCARCFYQRIEEWYFLWHDHPGIWADAEDDEATYGHTFRTPGRDTWPTALREMRLRFENGEIPLGAQKNNRRNRYIDKFGDVPPRVQLTITGGEEDAEHVSKCRICSL